MPKVYIPLIDGHPLGKGYECKEWPVGSPLSPRLRSRGWLETAPAGATIFDSDGTLLQRGADADADDAPATASRKRGKKAQADTTTVADEPETPDELEE